MIPLLISDVPLDCINKAAYTYHVPAKLIISVLNIERGHVGQAVKNGNGTYDLGPMQINTSWWPKLYADGITPQQVLYDGCINVEVGSRILAKEIADSATVVSGVGNYHSHTHVYNETYSQKVRIRYTQLSKFLT